MKKPILACAALLLVSCGPKNPENIETAELPGLYKVAVKTKASAANLHSEDYTTRLEAAVERSFCLNLEITAGGFLLTSEGGEPVADCEWDLHGGQLTLTHRSNRHKETAVISRNATDGWLLDFADSSRLVLIDKTLVPNGDYSRYNTDYDDPAHEFSRYDREGGR